MSIKFNIYSNVEVYDYQSVLQGGNLIGSLMADRNSSLQVVANSIY